MKKEAASSSETTLVPTYKIARLHIPEDRNSDRPSNRRKSFTFHTNPPPPPIEPKRSLSFSQHHTIGSYAKPDQSNPHAHILFP
jgi:hypothetical protein